MVRGRCISFGGAAVDKAVEREILRVLEPGAPGAAMKAMDSLEREEDARQKRLSLALEQDRYEADRAFRQYALVDPGNRLVASELESRWNRAIVEVKRLEEEISSDPPRWRGFTPEEKRLVLSLSRDSHLVWEAPSTNIELKKRLVRVLIEQILVDVNEKASFVEMIVRWSGLSSQEETVRCQRIRIN